MNTDITTATYSTQVICTCNNCGAVFIDDNPGPGNLLYRIPSNVIIEEMLHDTDEDGPFIGCTHCATDGYLMDNLNPGAGGRAQALSSIIFPEATSPTIEQADTTPSIYTADEDTFWVIKFMTIPHYYVTSIADLILSLKPTYVDNVDRMGEHLYERDEFAELVELGGVTEEQAKLIDFISEKAKDVAYIRFTVD